MANNNKFRTAVLDLNQTVLRLRVPTTVTEVMEINGIVFLVHEKNREVTNLLPIVAVVDETMTAEEIVFIADQARKLRDMAMAYELMLTATGKSADEIAKTAKGGESVAL